jgi:hypothetical protein
MAIWMNGSLRLCLVGVAVAGLVDFAPIPAAGAQWLPPWGGASPGEIERSLEAQGYGLIAPLVRRPGIYLADVSAGPAGYQRLVVDARSGQILQRFVARGRIWGPALAARDEEFGEPVPLGVGSAGSSGFSGLPVMNPPAKKSYGGPANVHIPAATSPFGAGGAPAGRKPKLVSPAAAAKPPSIPRCRLSRHATSRGRTDQARQRPSRRRRMIRIRRKSTPVRLRWTTSRKRPRPRRQARPPSRPTERR